MAKGTITVDVTAVPEVLDAMKRADLRIAALEAERDAAIVERDEFRKEWDRAMGYWNACAERIRELEAASRPTPVRKLREVMKGEGVRFRWNPCIGPRAEFFAFDAWRECNHTQVLLYADVFEELKKKPYEPVETVEDVLKIVFDESLYDGTLFKSIAARLRAAVLAETQEAA